MYLIQASEQKMEFSQEFCVRMRENFPKKMFFLETKKTLMAW